MSFMIVCLPIAAPDLSPSYDFLRATDTAGSPDHGSATLPQLALALRGGDIFVLVPISKLSWHAVTLPKGMGPGSPRLRTVLDSLLEDRLLDDPGQLHLAIIRNATTDVNKGSVYWVAACDKSWLHSHLSAFESAGLTVTRIVPEFVPTSDAIQAHVIGNAEQPLLVATGQSIGGVVCLPLNVAALSLLPTAKAGAEQMAPTVFSEPAVAAVAERLLPGVHSLQDRYARWLEASRTDWDLAQFDLASTGRTRTFKRLLDASNEVLRAPRWRLARWGLVVLLGTNLLGLNALAWKEKSAQQAQRMAIQNTLTLTFPLVKVVVDAPLQMQREVTALRQATGSPSNFGLEAVLNAIGPALPPGRTVSAIEMVNSEVRLKGLELSGQDVSVLSVRLKGQGYAVLGEGDVLLIKPLRQNGTKP
ncbi:MAG: type II secretion system protein GspL [Polaromonas sp.]